MPKILSTRAVRSSLLTVATCPIALFGICFKSSLQGMKSAADMFVANSYMHTL